MKNRLKNLKFRGIKFCFKDYFLNLTKDGKIKLKLLLFYPKEWRLGWKSQQTGEFFYLVFCYLAWTI